MFERQDNWTRREFVVVESHIGQHSNWEDYLQVLKSETTFTDLIQ